MTKPVPRSRLNITYRTKIEGTPKKVKLPMRFLVLGDFTGSNVAPLGEREVHSIMPGMQLKSFMDELGVTAPIPKQLRQHLTGDLDGKITVRYKTPAKDVKVVDLLVTGTVTVSGMRDVNGLGDFGGELAISDKLKAVPLKDGKPDLTGRKLKIAGKVRGNLDQGGITGTVIDSPALTATSVRVDPESDNSVSVDDDMEVVGFIIDSSVTVALTIPLFEPNHFKPVHIADRVPETRRLVFLRRILLELRGYISGNPELRDTFKLQLETRMQEMLELQKYLKARYPQLLIDPTAAAAPIASDKVLEARTAARSRVEPLLTAEGMSAGDWQDLPLVSTKVDSVSSPPAGPVSSPPAGPVQGNLQFSDHKDVPADRFVNALAVFLVNVPDLAQITSIRKVMQAINELSETLDKLVQDQIHVVLHDESFQKLEASWRSLQDICSDVRSTEVIIDFLDIDKDALRQDLEDHQAYILNSALFRKVYVEEYDRYGGRPFGVMIGLYQFNSSDEDLAWLETMSQISAAAHCPFIAAVEPKFFGTNMKSWPELERTDDLETLLSMPQFAKWDTFRRTHEAAYIGLTLPRFLLRKPYTADSVKSKFLTFEEKIDKPEHYLWGNAAVLFARNMVRAFEESGWCQQIVGPLGGGKIAGMEVHMVPHHGHLELQPPVEIAIPDYRELQFANTGFISLIHCKDTADSTFFSARSVKKAIEFEEDLSTKNADLVCNLAYTLSITRLAHYVKRMVRDYIGSTADAPYIQAMLEAWLIEYVTTAVNPDDLTLRHYPFKAMSVAVEPKPGPFGWYKCTVSVLPHIQFQGMDVELRLEAALGGA